MRAPISVVQPGRRTSPEGRDSTSERGFLLFSLGHVEGGICQQVPSHPGTAVQAVCKQACQPKSACALKQLITLVEGVMTSLISLGVTTNLGDAIMTHLVARQMDKGSREAWETSMTSANDYPTFPQIREFVNNRVRALERAKAPSSQGPTSSSAKASSKPSVQRASFHTTSQGPSRQKTFPCDVCKGDHFVVMCPKFRSMTVAERRKVVANNMLCYNCCGRHSSANCKSPHKCKQCGIQHHTMLHIPDQRPAQPPPQTEAPQSSSTQQR